MNKQNEQARQFGRILEKGYQAQEVNAPENTDLKNTVISFAANHSPSRTGKRIAVGSAVSIAVAVLAASLLWFLSPFGESSLQFYIDADPRPSEDGSWIRTAGSQHRTVQFTDGSRIGVLPQTEARIAVADSKRVVVDLNRGALRLRVTPKRNNQWTVRAGPYQVNVIGTRFQVDWQADDSRLFVRVTKGRVSVHGPGIDTNGIYVAAGNLLRTQANSQFVSVGPARQWEAEASEIAIPTLNTGADTPPPSTGQEEPHPTQSQIARSYSADKENREKSSASQSWQQLAKAKKYLPAMRIAREVGIQHLSKRLPANDLWLLATTARYAGAFDDAMALFTAHRKRFGSNEKSRTAAYLLGELSLNQKRNAPKAKHWFSTYLAETPNGALHEEALGRLMTLCVQLGQTDEARRHAATYQRRYPTGPFSEQAGSILNP